MKGTVWFVQVEPSLVLVLMAREICISSTKHFGSLPFSTPAYIVHPLHIQSRLVNHAFHFSCSVYLPVRIFPS
jgi:hypothetical protein